MTIDEKAALIAERRALLATAESLESGEWDHASLCDGWRVRDVAAHAAVVITMRPLTAVWGIIRSRGDPKSHRVTVAEPCVGAEGRSRTGTGLPPTVFELLDRRPTRSVTCRSVLDSAPWPSEASNA